MPIQTPSHRFAVLDVFRGLFAFGVVLFHLRSCLVTPIVTNAFVGNAFLLVDFFFALSGFVIAYNYLYKINEFKQLKDFFLKDSTGFIHYTWLRFFLFWLMYY
jgi:peptidoglycan/LPS O-acetylase OafA/YrhL